MQNCAKFELQVIGGKKKQLKTTFHPQQIFHRKHGFMKVVKKLHVLMNGK
jgi:hypothetical protein